MKQGLIRCRPTLEKSCEESYGGSCDELLSLSSHIFEYILHECSMYLALRAVYCHCVARLDRELLSSEADCVAVVTRDDGDPRNENSSPV